MKNSKLLLCTWLVFFSKTLLTAQEEGNFGIGIQRCDSDVQNQLSTFTFPTMIRINEGINETMSIISNNSRQQVTTISNTDWSLKRGHNYSLKADFQAVRPASKVHIQLFLHLLPGKSPVTSTKSTTPIRLPFYRKNLCRTPGSGLHCPLVPGDEYTFKLNVRIPKQTPAVEGRLRMQLLNERRLPLLCFVLPLKVVD